MSLRSRLTLLTALTFTACLVVLSVLVPRLVRDSLVDRLDGDLRDTRALAQNAFDVRGQGGPGGTRSALSSAAYVELREGDGEVIAGKFLDAQNDDRSAPDVADDIVADGTPHTVGSLAGENPSEWRVALYRVDIASPFGTADARSGVLVVALPMSEVDATTSSVARIVWLTSGIALVVLTFVAWLVTGLGLRPLRRMERSAASITDAADLGRRVEHPSARTEIGKLGETINGMLGRLETSFSEQQATEARLRRFAADASHELRTPLTSIRGYAELYRRGGNNPEQVDRSMDRIEHEARRMGNLVDDLLLLARADAELPLDHQPVDLRTVVVGLASDARVVDPARTIVVTAEPCTVIGDRDRLTQAVANVITNARLHTPEGSPIEIGVRMVRPPLDGSEAGPARAEVTVIDHGQGLSPDQLEKVFERFYRADKARTRERGGSGLGLSITAAIIEAHGGTVTAHHTPGGGATFVLGIPLLGTPAPT